MVLAQDILDGQGVMLLGRHQILNQEQIENLDKMGYPGLYIDDKFSEEIEIAEVIKPSIHSKSLEIVHHLFIDRMEEDVYKRQYLYRYFYHYVFCYFSRNDCGYDAVYRCRKRGDCISGKTAWHVI